MGLGQDFQATLWIGLDWVSKNGPMSNSCERADNTLCVQTFLSAACTFCDVFHARSYRQLKVLNSYPQTVLTKAILGDIHDSDGEKV